MKLGRDEVLFNPAQLLLFIGHIAQGWIQGGAGICRRGVPDVFFRPDGHSNNMHILYFECTYVKMFYRA